MGVDHRFGKRRHVAQAQVQPLARDRMDQVRAVADQRQPAVDVAFGVHQPQPVGPPPALHPHAAQPVAEAALQFVREGIVV